MSEYTTSPTWRSRQEERGFDHSIDRIAVPTAPEVALFTPHQIEALAEQLRVFDNSEALITSLGATSLRRVGVRTVWEETNLRAMGVLPPLAGTAIAVPEYAELAGQPDNIAELLQWFTYHTEGVASAANTVLAEDGSVQNEEFVGERVNLSPADGLKGVAIEAGTAMQLGDWDLSIFLEEAMRKGLDASRPHFSIARWENPSPLRPGRHKITEVYDESGISFEIVRERAYFDIAEGKIHGIKRSVSRAIPNPTIVTPDEIRSVLRYLAQVQAPENIRKQVPLTEGAMGLMRTYERAIHEHPASSKELQYIVVPDSMSFIFRRPPEKV